MGPIKFIELSAHKSKTYQIFRKTKRHFCPLVSVMLQEQYWKLNSYLAICNLTIETEWKICENLYCSINLYKITTSVGNLLHSQQPSECNYLLRVLGFMAIILLKLSSALKQSRLCKVDIYLQIQLHHHGISARCCPWGKAAWTNSLHTSSASFCWEGSPSNWTLSPPECWRVARRGNSWSASKILEIVAYMASTNPRGPRPHPELARFCPCKPEVSE